MRVTVIATGFEKEIVTSSNSQAQTKTAQEEGIQKINESFRIVSRNFKEENGLFGDELEVPTYLRAARD